MNNYKNSFKNVVIIVLIVLGAFIYVIYDLNNDMILPNIFFAGSFDKSTHLISYYKGLGAALLSLTAIGTLIITFFNYKKNRERIDHQIEQDLTNKERELLHNAIKTLYEGNQYECFLVVSELESILLKYVSLNCRTDIMSLSLLLKTHLERILSSEQDYRVDIDHIISVLYNAGSHINDYLINNADRSGAEKLFEFHNCNFKNHELSCLKLYKATFIDCTFGNKSYFALSEVLGSTSFIRCNFLDEFNFRQMYYENLTFENCKFKSSFSISDYRNSTHSEKTASLNISDSTFQGFANFSGIKLGYFIIESSTFEDIKLESITIHKEFSIKNSTINRFLDLQQSHFNWVFKFENTKSNGEVYLAESQFYINRFYIGGLYLNNKDNWIELNDLVELIDIHNNNQVVAFKDVYCMEFDESKNIYHFIKIKQ